MLKSLIFTFITLVFSCHSYAQMGDSIRVDTEPKWQRIREIDIQHIALALRFDWEKKQALGTATISFAPFTSVSTIHLDAAKLTINKIILKDGNASLKFEYDGSERDNALKIFLEKSYTSSDVVTITIEYHTNHVNTIDPNTLSGSNGMGLRFSTPTHNDPTKPREIWSMGDPHFNRYWFPCYDGPNDLRTTELTATVDKDLAAISNGTLVATKSNDDGTKTFHWKADAPYPNNMTALVVGEYIDIKQKYGDVTLHNFGYPREAVAVKASVERLPDMMKFFSEKTGVPYQHKSYSQVFVQDLPWGIGYNGLSVQSENMIDDYWTHHDFLYLWDALEGETLAQQWFGNHVSYNDWSEVWLSKGFGVYFSRLYNEYKNGHEEFLLYQPSGSDLSAYLWDWNSGNHHPIVTKEYETPLAFTWFDNYPNLRGSLVLHMLRKHLGDELWWKSINIFLTKHPHQSVSTEDLRRAVEEASGQPMDWFFEQWVYKMGHPIFEVSKSFDAAKHKLTVNVIQTQTPDSASTYPQQKYFQGNVDIEIDNKIETVWLEPKKVNAFVVDVQSEPKLVNFDFEGAWIKEITFRKTQDELLYQLLNDKDVLGRRFAMTELVALAKTDIASAEKQTIYRGLRSLIQSNVYWRLKMNALAQLQSLLVKPNDPTPVKFDSETTKVILAAIKNETSWTKATAISLLGAARDPKYADVFIKALKDSSDRVINSAAVALGKTKSPKAFDALKKLVERPSWKNQSLMSALAGLQALGDKRGYDIAYKSLADLNLLRWRLPTPPVWDFRVMAVETIVKLGRGEEAYPLLLDHFNHSFQEDDLEGIFNNTLLITKLGVAKGAEIFPRLKEKYKNDANAMVAIEGYEGELKTR